MKFLKPALVVMAIYSSKSFAVFDFVVYLALLSMYIEWKQVSVCIWYNNGNIDMNMNRWGLLQWKNVNYMHLIFNAFVQYFLWITFCDFLMPIMFMMQSVLVFDINMDNALYREQICNFTSFIMCLYNFAHKHVNKSFHSQCEYTGGSSRDVQSYHEWDRIESVHSYMPGECVYIDRREKSSERIRYTAKSETASERRETPGVKESNTNTRTYTVCQMG